MTVRPVSEIPGLRPLPLLGDRVPLARLFRDPVRMLMGLHRRHGTIAALAHDPPFVCAFGPELNQQIMPHPREHEHFAEVPLRIPPGSAAQRMQANLTVMTGDRHQAQRRLLMPAFNRAAVHAHRDAMVAVTERHVARWRDGADLDLARELVELTLGVMLRCLFGVDLPDDRSDVLRFLGKDLLGLMTAPAALLLPLDLPFTPYGRYLRLCERIEARVLALAHERRAEELGHDVLSIIVRAHDEDGGRLTDAEVVGHLSLLVMAGHETTANALTWTLLLLDQHPEIHAALHEELHGELRGEAPTVEQLGRLPLLDAVVKESMRILPPTYMMFIRRACSSFSLGPYELPPGAMVLLSSLVTHHMPEVWPEPERFRPARWSGHRPTPFEFMPFGAGPRLCLGAALAEQEVRVLLAMIVQRFTLRLRPGTRVDVAGRGITLGPRRAVPVRVTRQRGTFETGATLGGSIRELVRLPG